MLHKASKPGNLVGSYRPLSLTSCLSKLLEKAVADNLSNCAEVKKNSTNNKMDCENIGAQIYLNFLKQLKLASIRVTLPQEPFLMLRKPSTKFGMMGFSLS